MTTLKEAIAKMQPLTIGETIQLANDYDARVVDVVLEEAINQTGLPREEILTRVMDEYAHNLKALDIGLEDGESVLMGTAAADLNKMERPLVFDDVFLDNALLYTQAAQVGNHCIGLRPCAGTGDSCPYAGFIKAMQTANYDELIISEIAALILKIGSIFRVAKITTGCNLEGFGAGAASIAAATVALNGGTSSQMEQAIVLAMSPTIAVPCTPRVLVPALCTSHIGGAILIGMYAGKLCTLIDIGVNVPVDVMIAMASEVHVESARHVVPTVVEYMEPFFRRTDEVESLVDQEVKDAETQEINLTLEKAKSIAKGLARGTDTLINVFGDAVVGGSSQGVGSPTNAARIAHGLAKGEIRKIKIELYPELFARRTINIPGILMGAVFGSDTSDYEMYNKAISLTKEKGIEIEILEAEEESVQKITIETDEMTAMVDSLNRGGGRVHLRDATPSLEQAKKVAADLSIVLG